MIRALYSAASGMTAQQTQHRQHRQQPRQRQHRRVQVAARPVSGPALSEPGSARRRRRVSQTIVPSRSAARARHARLLERNHFHAGRFHQHRAIRSIWSSRATDSSRSSSPDGTIAYTRAGNFQLDANRQYRRPPTAIRCMPQITIPPAAQSITIATDGTVSYSLPESDRGCRSRARSPSRTFRIRPG